MNLFRKLFGKKPIVQNKNQKSGTEPAIEWDDPELVRGLTNYINHVKSKLKAAPEVKPKPINSQEELRKAFELSMAEYKACDTLIMDAVRRANREKELEQAVADVKIGIA